jgi:hypothetical protein
MTVNPRAKKYEKNVKVYYDRYQEDQKFLIGYQEGVIKFVVENTKDLSTYVKALENYEK